MKKKLPEYLAQTVMIVFSVVLGLYLSERIAESKEKKASVQLLSLIKFEIGENEALLKDWHPYHIEIYNTFDSLYKSNDYLNEFIQNKNSLLEHVLTRGTFMRQMPSNDAWEISKSNPIISSIKYKDLLILSKLYKQQNLTFSPVEELFNLFNSPGVNSPQEAKSNLGIMKSHMHELVARERVLLSYYKEASRVLNIKRHTE